MILHYESCLVHQMWNVEVLYYAIKHFLHEYLLNLHKPYTFCLLKEQKRRSCVLTSAMKVMKYSQSNQVHVDEWSHAHPVEHGERVQCPFSGSTSPPCNKSIHINLLLTNSKLDLFCYWDGTRSGFHGFAYFTCSTNSLLTLPAVAVM